MPPDVPEHAAETAADATQGEGDADAIETATIEPFITRQTTQADPAGAAEDLPAGAEIDEQSPAAGSDDAAQQHETARDRMNQQAAMPESAGSLRSSADTASQARTVFSPTALGAATAAPSTEAEGPNASAATPADTPAPDTADRLVQSMRMQYLRGGGDALVQLRPEHLGPVTIALRVEDGAVSARITADNAAVAEWLQANEHSLRDGLKANGLQLDRLVVDRDGQSPHHRSQREAPPRRNPRADLTGRESTFEVHI
jgi:flagellar hook-length control protein FliK